MGHNYQKAVYSKSQLKSVEKFEGEPLAWKVERIITSKEPITDGAETIYTDRKDGVKAGYNIRTDRFEVAAEAMDKVQASIQAKRDEKGEKKSAKVIKIDKDGGAEPTNGTTDTK